MNIEVRPATAADIDEFYGERPAVTLHASVVTLDGAVVAVVGLAHEFGYKRFFSEFKPELAAHLKSVKVLRVIGRVMAMVRASRQPVVAVADNPALLERLGFIQLEDEVYLWPGSPPSPHTSG